MQFNEAAVQKQHNEPELNQNLAGKSKRALFSSPFLYFSLLSSLQNPKTMDTLTPCRHRPSMSGRYITLAARQLRDSRVNRFIDHRATKASTTPVPSKTPKEKATRSSEKETPTVVGTQGPGPLVLGHHDELDAATNAASVAGSRKSTVDASIATSTNSSNSSSEETEKDVQAQATMMLQTTLECGIASICRLRKLYPSSFFKKSDLEGTSVTQFDVEHLENLLDSDNTQEESMEGEFGGETLSPLTTTQKTHNTAQYTQRERRGRGREDTQRDVSDAKAATEALMLIRWIGKQGVNVLMKKGQLASVHFGIMLPKDEEGCDELLEQYVVSYHVAFCFHSSARQSNDFW
jgi:hypothetical protein